MLTCEDPRTCENPWLVESIEPFLYFNCPECDFKAKENNLFQNHSVENHPLSFVFFGVKTELGSRKSKRSNEITTETQNKWILKKMYRKRKKTDAETLEPSENLSENNQTLEELMFSDHKLVQKISENKITAVSR